MAVEKITPQLVKKGKGKKRPGYRGPGGYQGSSGGSKASSGGPAGGASAGGNYGGNRNPSQSYGGSGQGGATRPNPHTKSGTSKTSKVSAKDIARSKREFVQNLNHNNAVRAAQTGQKFTPYKGGSRPQGGSLGGLGSLIMSGLGMLMGIPGLGLLTGGLGSLKDKLGDTFGNFNEKMRGINPVTGKANTQAEYEAMVADRRTQSRIDKMQDRINRGYNQIGFGDFTKTTGPITDNQRATLAGLLGQKDRFGNQFGPSTAQNVLTGRDLKGFTESRGLQTPQTFSDPFANTVGTTTKVNAPASDAVSSYVPFSNYGKANAATGTTVDGVPLEEFVKNAAIAPTPVEQYKNKAYTGIQENVGKPISNFLNNLMNADQIAALENEYGNKYGITNTSGGISSDARHMAAMNNLSNSLSPFNNKFGNFIGDTGAFAAGLINELPALGRGFNKQNLGEIGEDIAANFRGSFGTPNQTTAEQIYGDVFEGSTPARTASVPTYGTASAEDITIDGGMFNSPFMENQIGPRVIAAENAYYNQGKMPPEFLGDRLRMNMELGNARGFMGPGFAQGGLASMFTRRG